MTAVARFAQVDVTRLLKAAKACGYESAKVTIDPDGTLTLTVNVENEQSIPMGQELE